MNNLFTTPFFDRRFKKLKKKYLSLASELAELGESLISHPTQGTSLGDNIYKIRLASQSKGKGKSGGFRVITYLTIQTETDIDIYLITIYDKSEVEDIPKADIQELINEIFGEN